MSESDIAALVLTDFSDHMSTLHLSVGLKGVESCCFLSNSAQSCDVINSLSRFASQVLDLHLNSMDQVYPY